MSGTLLLNASNEPLCEVKLRRAVILVLNNRAEIVEHADTEIRSELTSIPRPVVIRLKNYVRVPYRASVILSRSALMARDKSTCQYCWRKGDTIDHVIPKARGGQHVWSNVVIACKSCNNKKDDRLLSELGWKLSRSPAEPLGSHWILVALTKGNPAWEKYLLRPSDAVK